MQLVLEVTHPQLAARGIQAELRVPARIVSDRVADRHLRHPAGDRREPFLVGRGQVRDAHHLRAAHVRVARLLADGDQLHLVVAVAEPDAVDPVRGQRRHGLVAQVGHRPRETRAVHGVHGEHRAVVARAQEVGVARGGAVAQVELEDLTRLQPGARDHHRRVQAVLGAVLRVLDHQPLREQAGDAGAQLLQARPVPAERVRLPHQPDGALAFQQDRLAAAWGQLHRHDQVLVDVGELLAVGGDRTGVLGLRAVRQQQVGADQNDDPGAPGQDEQAAHSTTRRPERARSPAPRPAAAGPAAPGSGRPRRRAPSAPGARTSR